MTATKAVLQPQVSQKVDFKIIPMNIKTLQTKQYASPHVFAAASVAGNPPGKVTSESVTWNLVVS